MGVGEDSGRQDWRRGRDEGDTRRGQRQCDIGSLINAGDAGQELFEISDLHKVRIHVQLPQAFHGRAPAGAELAQHARRVPPDNADGELFAVAYCQMHFRLPGDQSAMRVPALVLADRGSQDAVRLAVATPIAGRATDCGAAQAAKAD